MIRNYQKNGVDVNLNPIYQSISSLKNNIADLESLTTLSSLSSLSNDIWSLSTNLDAAWINITGISAGIENVILPIALSNSSNIDSINNYLTSIDSSLASLQQSYSDITNSLSTLTGGGLLTNSTFNYQAFNTTYDLGKYLHLTGDFSLNNAFSINASGGDWNLSQLGTNYSFSSFSISNLQHFTLNNFASFNSNSLSNINKFNICGETVEFNKITSSKIITNATIEANTLSGNTFYFGCLDCNCNGVYKNSFNYGTIPNGKYFKCSGGKWCSDSFIGIRSVNLLNCEEVNENYFARIGTLEINNCSYLKKFSLNELTHILSFKNCNFSSITVGSFLAFDNPYTCTIIFENCFINNSITDTSAFTNLFTTLNTGASMVYSFR